MSTSAMQGGHKDIQRPKDRNWRLR